MAVDQNESNESNIAQAQKWNFEEWALEEYKLLSKHYFHEDNYYLTINSFFITFETALVTFHPTNVPNLSILSLLIGIVIGILWFISLKRVHYLRTTIENRIKDLEYDLHEIWKEKSPLRLAQIRSCKNNSFWEEVKVSKIMPIVPIIFIGIFSLLFLLLVGSKY